MLGRPAEQRQVTFEYDREPEVGDDVHLKGRSPKWHNDLYLRRDEYRWPEVRANGEIVSFIEDEEEDDIVEVWLYGDGIVEIPMRKFQRYIKRPDANCIGCWFIV